MDTTPTIVNARLELCCTKVIEDINGRIKCGNALQILLIPEEVLRAFFYPPGYSAWASLASTSFSLVSENWVALARAVQAIPVITRRAIQNDAQYHALDHVRDNKRKLQLFWEGVYYAFE